MKSVLLAMALTFASYSFAQINEAKTQRTVKYEYGEKASVHIFYSLDKKTELCTLTNFEYSEEKGTNATIAVVPLSECEGLVVSE